MNLIIAIIIKALQHQGKVNREYKWDKVMYLTRKLIYYNSQLTLAIEFHLTIWMPLRTIAIQVSSSLNSKLIRFQYPKDLLLL